jgi:hypothetical protein
MTVILGTAKNGRDFKLNGVKTTVGGTKNEEGKYYVMEPISLTGGTEYKITKGTSEALVMLIFLK